LSPSRCVFEVIDEDEDEDDKDDDEDANKRVAVDDEPASIEMTLENTLRVLSSVRKGNESNLTPSFPLDG